MRISLVILAALVSSCVPAVCDNDTNAAHVYILAGQSNATGRDTVDNLSDENSFYGSPYPQVRYSALQGCPKDNGIATSCNIKTEWIDLKPGVDVQEPGFFGPELSIGRFLKSSLPNDIYIIKTTHPGTSLKKDWISNPDEGRYMYPRSLAFIKGQLALIKAPYKVVGVFWVQGEQDATAAIDGGKEYQDNLIELILEYRRDLGQDLHFVLSRLSARNKRKNGGLFQDLRVQEVIDAQNSVGKMLPRVTVVPTIDLEMGTGNVHFTADGTIALGTRLAEVI